MSRRHTEEVAATPWQRLPQSVKPNRGGRDVELVEGSRGDDEEKGHLEEGLALFGLGDSRGVDELLKRDELALQGFV
jgi:hypothetical protein